MENDYENELFQQIEEYRDTYDNGEAVYYIDDVEVTEYDFYEEMNKVIERERQEDALDSAQAMEEAELRDEYFRGFESEEQND